LQKRSGKTRFCPSYPISSGDSLIVSTALLFAQQGFVLSSEIKSFVQKLKQQPQIRVKADASFFDIGHSVISYPLKVSERQIATVHECDGGQLCKAFEKTPHELGFSHLGEEPRQDKRGKKVSPDLNSLRLANGSALASGEAGSGARRVIFLLNERG
jgi:hypothetical protein